MRWYNIVLGVRGETELSWHREKNIRRYLCILPAGSDSQVRDVRFLGRTQERCTDDEVAVHGDHRTPLWGIVQGVAD